MRSGRPYGTGFSIVELMFVLVIITVLATVAAPSFVGTQLTDKLVQASGEVYRAFEFARSRAILRGSAMRIIIRPNVAANDATPNIRVDESWNDSCEGWATSVDSANEANVNNDCSTWQNAPERCGVYTVRLTSLGTYAAYREAGIAFGQITIGGAVDTSDPLVLCMNRRGRLLVTSVPTTCIPWLPAGGAGSGVDIEIRRYQDADFIAQKVVRVPQSGVPGLLP